MRSRLLLVALLAASCGPGLNDPELDAAPLVVIRGHADPALFTSTSGGSVHAALTWAAATFPDPACILYGHHAELKGVCRDPLRVSMALLDRHVPVDLAADGTFEIPLYSLPDAEVVVGDRHGRIAYANLLLVEDVDRNGLIEPTGGFGPPVDVVLGASFPTLAQAQQRLVFREGTFDAASNFYPAPGCPEPPQGFSILRAPEYRPDDPLPGCSVESIDTVIEVEPLTEAQRQAFLCPFSGGWFSPPAPYIDERAEVTCLEPGVAAFIYREDACPSALVMPLVGCHLGDCDEPEWDLRDDPPEWWSC